MKCLKLCYFLRCQRLPSKRFDVIRLNSFDMNVNEGEHFYIFFIINSLNTKKQKRQCIGFLTHTEDLNIYGNYPRTVHKVSNSKKIKSKMFELPVEGSIKKFLDPSVLRTNSRNIQDIFFESRIRSAKHLISSYV